MGTDLDPRTGEEYAGQPKLLNREIFYKGDTIIKQGDPGHRAFYIETGHVEITVHEDRHDLSVSELGPGEIFGEMSIIQGGNRSATAKALEDTTVTVISKDELEKIIDKIDHKAVSALMKVLINRLRQANKGQLFHYRNLAEFQERITGLFFKADEGINKGKRDAFRAEAEPLLKQLETLLDKYKD